MNDKRILSLAGVAAGRPLTEGVISKKTDKWVFSTAFDETPESPTFYVAGSEAEAVEMLARLAIELKHVNRDDESGPEAIAAEAKELAAEGLAAVLKLYHAESLDIIVVPPRQAYAA